jgi:Polyketide synthase dehydratase N-terminal domain
VLAAANGSSIEAADIYRVYFHGPAYQVIDRAWRDGDRMIGQMAAGLPSNHEPATLPTVMGPRLIELCFQTAGLWQLSEQGQMGLPLYVHQVRAWHVPEPAAGPFFAAVTPHPNEQGYDAEVVDAKGNCYIQLSGYKTVALPYSVDAEPLKALQAAMSQQVVLA